MNAMGITDHQRRGPTQGAMAKTNGEQAHQTPRLSDPHHRNHDRHRDDSVDYGASNSTSSGTDWRRRLISRHLIEMSRSNEVRGHLLFVSRPRQRDRNHNDWPSPK